MQSIQSQTKEVLRARINKGQSHLDTAHKIVFTTWHTQYMNAIQRHPAKYTKAQLIEVFEKVADIYRMQKIESVDQTFDHNTSPWLTRVRNRAARIRDAAAEVKRLIAESAPISKVQAAKAAVKTAMAER